MICPNCGEKNPDNARVCNSCGSSIFKKTTTNKKTNESTTVKFPIFCRLPASGWNRAIGIPMLILGGFLGLIAISGRRGPSGVASVVGFMALSLIVVAIILLVRSFKNLEGTIYIGDRVIYEINNKRVEIDIDKISSIRSNDTATYIYYNGGQVSFHSYSSDKIASEIGKRQKESASKKVVYTVPVDPAGGKVSFSSKADEIKKYKELLDSGALTKEQYDTVIQKLIS